VWLNDSQAMAQQAGWRDICNKIDFDFDALESVRRGTGLASSQQNYEDLTTGRVW